MFICNKSEVPEKNDLFCCPLPCYSFQIYFWQLICLQTQLDPALAHRLTATTAASNAPRHLQRTLGTTVGQTKKRGEAPPFLSLATIPSQIRENLTSPTALVPGVPRPPPCYALPLTINLSTTTPIDNVPDRREGEFLGVAIVFRL